jgi:hypothetical protein
MSLFYLMNKAGTPGDTHTNWQWWRQLWMRSGDSTDKDFQVCNTPILKVLGRAQVCGRNSSVSVYVEFLTVK